MYVFQKEQLESISEELLCRAGVPQQNAKTVARSLVMADLRGTHSHGVIRLKNYIEAIERGAIDPKAETEVVKDTPASLLIDGNFGLGQIIGTYSMQETIKKAQATGIACAGVRNSSHFGIAAYYSMIASKKGMIGLAMTNTRPIMPPSGGKRALLGNNPIAIAIPAQRHPDIVLDMACSVAAFGKIRLAAARGETIPMDWALDKNGVPTKDPNEAVESGLVLPMASHKGYGLALVIDMLVGVLTQSAYCSQIRSIFLDPDNPERIGHFFIAINVSSFIESPTFKDCVDGYIDTIKNCPRRDGVKEIYLPGEIEYNNYIKRMNEGIPIDSNVVAELQKLGSKYKVEGGIINAHGNINA